MESLITMKITAKTLKDILLHYSPASFEQGGILGIKGGIVCVYEHDDSAQSRERAVYSPNVSFLNQCIEKWDESGIEFCGIVHSHPVGQDTLSSGDMDYIKALYSANPQLEKIFFPLVINGCGMIVYATEIIKGDLTVSKESIETVA